MSITSDTVTQSARISVTSYAIIRDLAAAAPVTGFDETGARAIGSLHWLHVASTPHVTWYYAHKRRGREAMDAAGILAYYRGCAVHDFWKSYFDYSCNHALCNSHLLRELIFLWEEQNQEWAKEMIDHLLGIKETVAMACAAGLSVLPPSELDRFLKDYERIVQVGYARNPVAEPAPGPKRRGRRKQSKARKNKVSALDALQRVFLGSPIIPDINTL